jgi:uncharacterized protein YcfJ
MTRNAIALTVAAAVLGLGLAAPADARAPRAEFGQVVRVDPIIDRVEVPISREECWSQPVTYREPVVYRTHRSRDRAPAVMGAIVGGVIGNQFGSGSGRDAATVAGAALGYAAVRDSQRHGSHYYAGDRQVTRHEQRCEVRTSYRIEEQVTGYDVTYRYRGQTYRTVTDYHPGDRIELMVDVRPVR